MMNTDYFTLLAGDPAHWDLETADRWAAGEHIASIQRDQFVRGRRSAQLIRGRDGFYVRSATSLDAKGILLNGWHPKKKAIAWGKAWAGEDPTNREFFVHNGTLEKE